jgi:CheY-like chemotaxis protein
VGSNYTILIVDDNHEVRMLTERILTRAGYQVLAFNSGRDALKVITERTITCALVDVTLADMHGYEVCRQIAALNPNIPLALVSGYLVDAAHLVDVPIFATLQKPFRAEELLTLVRRLITAQDR